MTRIRRSTLKSSKTIKGHTNILSDTAHLHDHTTTTLASRNIRIIFLVHRTPHRRHHVVFRCLSVLYQARKLLASKKNKEGGFSTCCRHHSFCSEDDHNHLLTSGSGPQFAGISIRSSPTYSAVDWRWMAPP